MGLAPRTTFECFKETTLQLKKDGITLSKKKLEEKLSSYDNKAQTLLTSVFGVAADKTDLNNDGTTDAKDLAFKLCRLGEGQDNKFSPAEAASAHMLAENAFRAEMVKTINPYGKKLQYGQQQQQSFTELKSSPQIMPSVYSSGILPSKNGMSSGTISKSELVKYPNNDPKILPPNAH